MQGDKQEEKAAQDTFRPKKQTQQQHLLCACEELTVTHNGNNYPNMHSSWHLGTNVGLFVMKYVSCYQFCLV